MRMSKNASNPHVKPTGLLKYIQYIPALFLFSALISGLPSTYLAAIRLVVTLSVMFLGWQAIERKSYRQIVALLVIAILFSPIVHAGLTRTTWRIIYITAVLVFIVIGVIDIRSKKVD